MADLKRSVGAIILAAGKGSRMNSQTENKVALPFHGKPIIKYSVEVMSAVAQDVVVVVGAMAESVKKALDGMTVRFTAQEEQLGTGHALQIGFEAVKSSKPALVLVGYGDHMMFYKPETLQKLIEAHEKERAEVSFLTTTYSDPSSLAWARITRDEKDDVTGIVEQKDASEEELKIQEINPGFYCFSAKFLEEFLPKITKSPVTNEYYLTDLLQLAFTNNKKIVTVVVPFEEVGIGINRAEELQASQELYSAIQKN